MRDQRDPEAVGHYLLSMRKRHPEEPLHALADKLPERPIHDTRDTPVNERYGYPQERPEG